jgi:hypothetical protein
VRGILVAAGGLKDILQKEGAARPPWLGSGRSSRRLPLVGGLTASGTEHHAQLKEILRAWLLHS